ncbi:MAG: heparan-alpha-glucosaminide N-acetyltransferase domain-containing protein [Bryobacteraceae bacterium]
MIEHQTRTLDDPTTSSRASARLPFLDWARGLAALIMLVGHTFHSYARPDLRDSGPYVITQFIGGIAPAMFLFLSGVTLAFLMHRQQKNGAVPGARIRAALKRAGFLLALAYAFRFQLWLFGLPHSQWTDLLKADILNCMGLAIAALALMAGLTTAQRVHGGVIAGLLIATASPIISLIDPASLPALVRLYFVPDTNLFTFFPWASFVGFGLSAGSILRLVHSDQSLYMHRVMQWAAIVGFGLIITGQYFSNLPYSLYPASDFWLNSPGLVFIKLGVIMVLLALAFLWTHHGAGQGWGPLRQLGITSLLVYWVHIELVYGRWFWFFKENLSIAQCTAVSAVLIVLMLALSYARTNWDWQAIRNWFNTPSRVSQSPERLTFK